MKKKKIRYGDKIPVHLTPREVDLIINHAFVDQELAEPLKIAEVKSGNIIGKYSLDDLDILLGCIAAESNHAKTKKIQKEFDALFDWLHALMDSYIEEET